MVNKIFKTIIFLLIIFLIGSCISHHEETKKIKIVTSNWIGYAPILYAYEKGELDDLNTELIVSTSLQSSVLMYEKNKYDGICSTKQEIDHINNTEQKNLHLTPIVIFNRSYGGDVILSDIPKEKLYNDTFKQINVFLEKGSVNEVLFDNFKKMTNLDIKYNIHYINQYNITDLQCDSLTPKLIITYEPYATKLKEKGFHIIDSTKNDKLLVFDFLSTKEGVFNKSEIKQLQTIINNAILELQNNPKKFFETVKVYFSNISYKEFISSLDEIQLFTKERKEEFLSLIKKENICKKIDFLKEQ